MTPGLWEQMTDDKFSAAGPITPSTRQMLACFELVEKLRADLSLFITPFA
jgi:hypothetical protein